MARRRNDPWTRFRRKLSAGSRRDLQLVLTFGLLLDEGHEPAAILAKLGLSDDDAAALSSRIGEALRRARIRPEPSSQIAHVLAAISEARAQRCVATVACEAADRPLHAVYGVSGDSNRDGVQR
jgi:hypothetical protein